MMDFIYELYQNDNFVLYLTIALVILIVLFVLVLIFGKRDQKLEETKRLQKIDVDAFKEEKKEETKLEVIPEPKKEEKIEVKTEEPKKETKSIFDDTEVLPVIKENDDSEEINVTTFEPTKVDIPEKKEEPKKEELPVRKPLIDIEEESKPINIKELDEIKFDDINLEKDLGESAISVTIVPRGILASGNPTSSLAWIAAITFGPIEGLARPISSYAITLIRR